MFVLNLKSLVLHDISVLSGGLIVDSRLDSSNQAGAHQPEVPLSTRHANCRGPLPLLGRRWMYPTEAGNDRTAIRAGRSDSWASVFRYHPPCGEKAASIREPWWATTIGGHARAAATCENLARVLPVASVAGRSTASELFTGSGSSQASRTPPVVVKERGR